MTYWRWRCRSGVGCASAGARWRPPNRNRCAGITVASHIDIGWDSRSS